MYVRLVEKPHAFLQTRTAHLHLKKQQQKDSSLVSCNHTTQFPFSKTSTPHLKPCSCSAHHQPAGDGRRPGQSGEASAKPSIPSQLSKAGARRARAASNRSRARDQIGSDQPRRDDDAQQLASDSHLLWRPTPAHASGVVPSCEQVDDDLLVAVVIISFRSVLRRTFIRLKA
jgi:hypothetical protein